MARLPIFRIFIAASTGVLIALLGCGGSSNESDPVRTVSIDTTALRTHEDVAQAAAAEHGAPGENEQLSFRLVGDKATEDLVKLLRDRGFADVSVGAR
jgi:hypothetical protein